MATLVTTLTNIPIITVCFLPCVFAFSVCALMSGRFFGERLFSCYCFWGWGVGRGLLSCSTLVCVVLFVCLFVGGVVA